MLGSHECNYIPVDANKLLLKHGGIHRGDADVSKQCGCLSHPGGRTEDVPQLNIESTTHRMNGLVSDVQYFY